MDIPLWLSIVLYLVAGLAIAGVVYLLVLTAVRHAMRAPLAEVRTARRRQEDLLREISTSAAYLADVADAWAEGEAERRASAGALGVSCGETETPSPWSAEGAALAEAARPGAVESGAVEPEVPRDAAGQPVSEPGSPAAQASQAAEARHEPEAERNDAAERQDAEPRDAERRHAERRDDEPEDDVSGPAVGSSSSRFSA